MAPAGAGVCAAAGKGRFVDRDSLARQSGTKRNPSDFGNESGQVAYPACLRSSHHSVPGDIRGRRFRTRHYTRGVRSRRDSNYIPSPPVVQVWAVVALMVGVWIALSGSLRNGFVDWDDRPNLVDNPAYQGLSPAHLRWMFTTSFAGHYQPLTWISHAIDFKVWGGVDAFGTHLTNLVLHFLTAAGFFLVAIRLVRSAHAGIDSNAATAGAWVAAMLFAVHPLRVESVVWATERRDVLSAAWLMLATYLYLRYVEGSDSRRPWLFLAAWLSFVCSLLSKAVGMTWPLVLLILDFYPMKRFSGPVPGRSIRTRSILFEKVAFLLPAIGCGIMAIRAQHEAGALWSFEAHPLSLRVAQAFYAIVFYLWKSLVPYPLLPLYEQPPNAAPWNMEYVAAGVVVAAATLAFLAFRRRFPGLLMAWAVYWIVLSPMLGLTQSGPQSAADRYSYLSCLPWCVVAGAAVSILWRRTVSQTMSRCGISLATLATMVGLVVLTRQQTSVWRDTRTLWAHVLRHAPNTGLAHANLAAWLAANEEWESARLHALRATEILPQNVSAWITAGRASLAMGDDSEAEQSLRRVVQLRTHNTDLAIHVAGMFVKAGRMEEAERCYAETIREFPNDAPLRLNYGGLLAATGRPDAAMEQFESALRIDPGMGNAYYRAAILRVHKEDMHGAVAWIERGLTVDPVNVELLSKLSWILATSPDDSLRDAPRALEVAQKVVRIAPPGHFAALESLAAAHAAVGNFDRAVRILDELLHRGTDEIPPGAADRLGKALTEYRAGRPYFENR